MNPIIKTALTVLGLIGVIATACPAFSDINARNEQGLTALHMEAGIGQIEALKRLIN